jgi:hypothetical protein
MLGKSRAWAMRALAATRVCPANRKPGREPRSGQAYPWRWPCCYWLGSSTS